jgi:hypothetical protein
MILTKLDSLSVGAGVAGQSLLFTIVQIYSRLPSNRHSARAKLENKIKGTMLNIILVCIRQ